MNFWYKQLRIGIHNSLIVAEEILPNHACSVAKKSKHLHMLRHLVIQSHIQIQSHHTESSAGILKQSMGARNRVGIGLSTGPQGYIG
jgi:hypothetical protein